jgi:three-Cys-motif partner protein
MPPRKPRLFDPKELGPRVPKQAPRPGLHAALGPSEQVRLNHDGAGLVPGLADGLPVRNDTQDGLPVRHVKPHSAQKAKMVSRDLGTVGRAMNRKWFDVEYIELFCGPGYLYDEATGEEVPGSPLQALDIHTPFDNYVFSDISDVCVDALAARLDRLRGERPGLPRTTVRQGDANDPAHLDVVCSLINPRSLVIAYLDPQKPNLHWTTVEYLAQRFQYIDFIINLPFSGIHRSLSAGSDERPRLMLGHPNPIELVALEEGRTAQNIRDYYDEQLRSLGLIHIARRCVKTDWSNSPLYDVVLASRNPTAVKLWEKANPAPKAVAQSSIFDLLG